LQQASPLQELTCHMGSNCVNCHRQRYIPISTQPITAGTQFTDPRGMEGWVNLGGSVAYRGDVPARRWSPTQY